MKEDCLVGGSFKVYHRILRDHGEELFQARASAGYGCVFPEEVSFGGSWPCDYDHYVIRLYAFYFRSLIMCGFFNGET